ncbi:MAG: DNA-binding response regulator [Candidatus Marinimicrobia bacterium CG_4_10_14_0_2_um_filter_48_9]|nr:MAG: DNA-binding response regulator [Candidatus Marinimicrobia bacterium CG_4_10_14_0_2_um_filter_48_9]
MTDHISVFIVDDNRLLREGLVSMMEEIPDFIVSGSAETGSEALKHIKATNPDVAVIDIGLPDKDGIEVTEKLRQTCPNVKVIILGMPDLTEEIMACIEAGASGYMHKEASFDTLVETIRAAHRGESFCSPQMANSLFSRVAELVGNQVPREEFQLTTRELEIISKVAQGMSNKEVATECFIEVQTVKNHIHNILDKLQLHNRFEAVNYARERNLLNPKS